MEVEAFFPDGTEHLYQIPTIKMSDYTKDMIFEKRLLMLLPFYVIRYEKDRYALGKTPEMLEALLREYGDICKRLERGLEGEGRGFLYTDLIGLITKIADYIFRDEEAVRKGIGDVMGGKVLQLESERLLAVGEAHGEARLSTLLNKMILDGRDSEIQTVVSDPEKRKKFYKEYGL